MDAEKRASLVDDDDDDEVNNDSENDDELSVSCNKVLREADP
jgi:hypothetical protein